MNKNQIPRFFLTSSFFITLALFYSGCSAVPTASRYPTDETNKPEVKKDENTNPTTPNNTSLNTKIDYTSVFDGFDSVFVKIPEKIQENSRNGEFWYKFEDDTKEIHESQERTGYKVQVFTSISVSETDSVESILASKTRNNEIENEYSNGYYHLYYGSYSDLSTASEAVIKLNQLGFRQALPVPRKILVKK